MNLTNEEIIRKYKNADDKRKQMKILCELNNCKEEVIREILLAGGVPRQAFPRERKKKDAASAPFAIKTTQEAKEAPESVTEVTVARTEPVTVPKPTEAVFAALYVAMKERQDTIEHVKRILARLTEDYEALAAFVSFLKQESERSSA